MVRVAALALVLTGGAVPDGGGDAPRIVSVRSGVVLGDDGRTYELDGGAWLGDELLLARARDLERLAAENAELKRSPPPLPAPPAGAFAVTIAVVAALAYLGGLVTPRP